MARPVYVIPREVFDARLVERAVDRGATFRRQRIVTSPVDGRLVLDGGIRRSWSARTAPTRCVRAHLGLPDGRRALAIRGYAPTPPDRRGTQVIRYGDRRQPAYAWAFDRGDGLSNVGYGELLPDAATGTRRRGRCCSTSSSSCCPARSTPASTGGATTCRCPAGAGTSRTAGCCSTGDAAGLINPMTGEGIYYAVATGIAAGRSAVRALRDGSDAGALHRRAVRGCSAGTCSTPGSPPGSPSTR